MRKITGLIFMTILAVTCQGVALAQTDGDADREYKERIRKQLELANQLREERLRKEREQQEQEQKEEETKAYCLDLKDDLLNLSEGHRRWYELDENGNRVFLTEAQVSARRDALQKKFENRCSDVE